eukprot:TRINITY_DN4930_c0_g1_i2.p1 TRINITY_DN4930_c0_g1~~TRINITY_DN4930_c0_g1_i2.p1  ORF type:complete len:473 (-),score=141.82 TRINITY_DN4930_c0_g1_i2:91-1509(-)
MVHAPVDSVRAAATGGATTTTTYVRAAPVASVSRSQLHTSNTPLNGPPSSASDKYSFEANNLAQRVVRAEAEVELLRSRLYQTELDLQTALLRVEEAAQAKQQMDALDWQLTVRTKDLADANARTMQLQHRVEELQRAQEASGRDRKAEAEWLAQRALQREREFESILREKEEAVGELERENRELHRVRNDDLLNAPIPRSAPEQVALIAELRRALEDKSVETVRLQSLVKEQRKQLNTLQKKASRGAEGEERDQDKRDRERQEVVSLQQKLLQEKETEVRNLQQLVQTQQDHIAMLNTKQRTTEAALQRLRADGEDLDARRRELSDVASVATDHQAKLLAFMQKSHDDELRIRLLEERAQRAEEQLRTRDDVARAAQRAALGKGASSSPATYAGDRALSPMLTDSRMQTPMPRSNTPGAYSSATYGGGFGGYEDEEGHLPGDGSRLLDVKLQLQAAKAERQRLLRRQAGLA